MSKWHLLSPASPPPVKTPIQLHSEVADFVTAGVFHGFGADDDGNMGPMLSFLDTRPPPFKGTRVPWKHWMKLAAPPTK